MSLDRCAHLHSFVTQESLFHCRRAGAAGHAADTQNGRVGVRLHPSAYHLCFKAGPLHKAHQLLLQPETFISICMSVT